MPSGLKSYWSNISTSVKTLKTGLGITKNHLVAATKQRDPLGPADENYFDKQNALFTTQYPKEQIPVPLNGRYKLHNEIDDCIVCDKCAKVCPVDCIDIEPIRSPEVIGKTSDGTAKRIYAAKFDIDMAKCMFCGLCTTVCPTECLTMTNEFDFSAFDFTEHNIPFGEMTPIEIIQRKQEFEASQKEKEAAKAKTSTNAPARPKVGVPKPQIKPTTGSSSAKPKVVVKPKVSNPSASENSSKPARSIIKPKVEKPTTDSKKPLVKPVIKPKMSEDTSVEKKKSARPLIKPKSQNRPVIPPPKKDKEQE